MACSAHRATICIFPEQRKLMGSSAQNGSGVHWCRRRVRFNEIPDKVPKVPEKVGEGLVQSQVRSNRVPEKVAEKVRRFRDALVQSQVKFNRVPEKVPEKVWEALVQSQVRFNGIIHGNPPEVFPALGFATRFSKKTLRLLGIPPKLIFIWGGVGVTFMST